VLSLLNYKDKIDAELEAFFAGKLNGAVGIEKTVIEELRKFTMRGGKRIRPIFMAMGYFLNGNLEEKVFRASISLELMQSYMLILDDLIDRSELRRNAPTMHRSFKFDEQTSMGLAIIAAHLANAYCHEVLIKSDFAVGRLHDALISLENAFEITGLGQLNDLTLPFEKKATAEAVTKVHKLKTAEYTIGGPMKVGASLSGYDRIDTIDSYAIPLGIAFQMQDDILGLFGDEKTLGKSVKSDVMEGKITHLVVYAMERVPTEDAEFLKKMLGNKDITDKEFERFKDIIRRSGGLEASEKEIKLQYAKALDTIPLLTGDSAKAEELKILAGKMINRSS
jgi:geranylgeranyl diphosphate synthase type I